MNLPILSSATPAVPSWRRWLRQPLGRGPWRRWRNILALTYTVLAIAGLHDYITLVSTPTIVGILALLYTPVLEKNPPGRFRFAWPALFFFSLYFLLPVKTTLYLAWCCAACLFLETFHRRVERTIPFILLLLTPITGYFVEIFSFPIRLQLTRLAGGLLGLAGLPATVAGNSITVRDQAFSVDPACVGLHMLVVSLFTALLLMNYFQTHYQRRLGTGPILLLLLVTAALNVLANLLRIICLVVLAISPANPLHDVLGLVFLLGYILLPLLPVIRHTVRRFGRPQPNATGAPTRTQALLAANIVLATALSFLVLLSFRIDQPHPVQLTARHNIPGYKIKEANGSILQLDNGRSLVYIKPIPGFFYPDHTPTICWRGSGYSFTSLADTVLAGTSLYTGILQKGNQRLYTAWWYDNGVHQTTKPVDWRWDWIHGAPAYSVINLTAASPQDLATELKLVLKTHPFSPLLGRPVSPPRVKIW
ncbi:MAG TPA: exosortase N [Puia sp.]|nr:exosortase N [Puia sp.]